MNASHKQSLRKHSEMANAGQTFILTLEHKRRITQAVDDICGRLPIEKKQYISNMIKDMAENAPGPGAFESEEANMLIILNCRYLSEPDSNLTILPFIVSGSMEVTYASYNALNRELYFRIDQDERISRLKQIVEKIVLPDPRGQQPLTSYPESMAAILRENAYINKPGHKNLESRTDPNSIKSLIDVSINQSQSIRLGLAIERFFADYITENGGVRDIRPSNRKDEKERDHLFMNEQTKTIFYSEWKANLNLDTEKSVSTVEKVIRIETELRNLYPGYDIKWALVGARYNNAVEIPPVVRSKYSRLGPNVLGVNGWLSLFGLPTLTNSAYKQLLNDIVQQMFF